MKSDESRGRIQQDSCFAILELSGKHINQVFAIRCGKENDLAIDAIFFQLEGMKYWHRFFLDAGIGFWEEVPQESVFRELNDEEEINLGDTWSLQGDILLSAACLEASTPSHCSHLRWILSSGFLTLSYQDEQDIDSLTLLNLEQSGVIM